jgi:uncharacterized phage protein gp47/JayE
VTTPLVPVIVRIDNSGIYSPPFDLVLGYIQDSYRVIYGQDINIDPDAQDGQLLGLFSDALNDVNNAAVASFNSFIPSYAVGAGLSSIVKINGIRRRAATSSRVVVEVIGQAGITIANARISDNLSLGTEWFIIGPVVVPAAGVISAEAICTTLGAIPAEAGTLTRIVTPLPGWQEVSNPLPAVLGNPIEVDAQLRRRQTKSTTIPALTVLESIQGNLLNLADVTRARVYQNDTGITDVEGIPPRSIACVVEGANSFQIGSTIAATKTPGIPTYGNISVVIVDKNGVPNHINYWQLSVITVSVLVFMRAVLGYTDTVGQYIQASIKQYLQNLEIGSDILLGDLYSPANLDGDAATEAIGLTQAALDPLGKTYTIDAPYGLAVARADMSAVGGPYPEGSNTINVGNTGYFTEGETIWVTLENSTYHRTIILQILGTGLVLATPIPPQRHVNPGALIYAVDDVRINFNEAANANNTNIVLNIS